MRLEDEVNHPARLIAFFGLKRTHPLADPELEGFEENKGEVEDSCQMFALLHYFNIDTEFHPDMMVPRCSMKDPNQFLSYHIVSVERIVGHAHMVPDFDDAS